MNKSNIVAIFLNSSRSLYNAIMEEKIALYLNKNKQMICSFFLYDKNIEKKDINKCLSSNINKIITFMEPSKEIIDYIDSLSDIEMIVVGRKISSKNVRCVFTDDTLGGMLAADYLYHKKCLKFLYVTFDDNECSIRRYNGFLSKLKEYNQSQNCQFVLANEFNREFVEKEILGGVGIFFFNDELMMNAANFLENTGISLSNVSFIGYDGINKFYPFVANHSSIYFDYDKIASTVSDMIMGNNLSKEQMFDVTLNRI